MLFTEGIKTAPLADAVLAQTGIFETATTTICVTISGSLAFSARLEVVDGGSSVTFSQLIAVPASDTKQLAFDVDIIKNGFIRIVNQSLVLGISVQASIRA